MKREVLYKIPSLGLEIVLEKEKAKKEDIKYHNASHGNQIGENFPMGLITVRTVLEANGAKTYSSTDIGMKPVYI